MEILTINGLPGSGKDTFVGLCSKYANCANLSTVDPVKEAAKILGWNGEKTPENRQFLSNLKDISDLYFDTSFNYIKTTIEELGSLTEKIDFIFIHCREPEQIARFKKELGAAAIYVDAEDRLKQEGRAAVLSNHADRNVKNFDYDITIYNNKDLNELEKSAKIFIEQFDKMKYRLTLNEKWN